MNHRANDKTNSPESGMTLSPTLFSKCRGRHMRSQQATKSRKRGVCSEDAIV
jgi:hypothetical protein